MRPAWEVCGCRCSISRGMPQAYQNPRGSTPGDRLLCPKAPSLRRVDRAVCPRFPGSWHSIRNEPLSYCDAHRAALRLVCSRVEVHGNFPSVTGLPSRVFHNLEPKPFIWTAKATDILEKMKRARAAR